MKSIQSDTKSPRECYCVKTDDCFKPINQESLFCCESFE